MSAPVWSVLPPECSQMSLPSPSSSRQSMAPQTPKLRDSCDNCASSKVRCTKEKPTCSRCAKRGIACKYVATKRPGRKHERRPSTTDGIHSHSSPAASSTINVPVSNMNNWFTHLEDSATLGTTDPIVSPTNILHIPSTPATSGVSTDLFPGLPSAVDSLSTAEFSDLTADLDDLLAQAVSFPMSSAFETDTQSSMDIENGNTNTTTDIFDHFLLFPDSLSGLQSPPFPPSSNDDSSSGSLQPRHQDLQIKHGPSGCLRTALGLINELSPDPQADCTISTTTQMASKPTDLPPIQDIIVQNQEVVETASKMLSCRCSQDGYLLLILPLVILKVLDLYMAAARSGDAYNKNHSSSPGKNTRIRHSAAMGFSQPMDTCLDSDDDSGRMAGQLVLSELHRVQRFINHFSARLKEQGESNSGRTAATPNSSGPGSAETEMTPSFSVATLHQVDVDLKKRLRSLFLEIAESLRRK